MRSTSSSAASRIFRSACSSAAAYASIAYKQAIDMRDASTWRSESDDARGGGALVASVRYRARTDNGRRIASRRDRKRPTLRAPGPHAKYEDPGYQREETEEDHLNVRCREDEDPPGKRHQAGQRIEPHAIRASTLTSASSQHRKRP